MNGQENTKQILSELRTGLVAELDGIRQTGGGDMQTAETRMAGRRAFILRSSNPHVSGDIAVRSSERLILSADSGRFTEECKVFSRRTLSAVLYLLREYNLARDPG